jgi:hypothetical protein
MISIVGDVHDQIGPFIEIVKNLPNGPVIQVGDLGFHAEPRAPESAIWRDPGRKVLFIDGNRDHFYPATQDATGPTEIAPNLIYVPRGCVLDLDGRRVGFLGGGDSISDRAFRKIDVDWWPDLESVSPADVERLVANAKGAPLDLLITHTPPAYVIEALSPGKPVSPSARMVDHAFNLMGCPDVICGHQHKSAVYGQVRVLQMLEVASF